MRYGKAWATRPPVNEFTVKKEVVLVQDEYIKEVSYILWLVLDI